jgi:hypothetical protein
MANQEDLVSYCLGLCYCQRSALYVSYSTLELLIVSVLP